MISNRVSETSCDKNYFDRVAFDYSNLLKIVDLMIASHISQVKPSVKLKGDKLFLLFFSNIFPSKFTLHMYIKLQIKLCKITIQSNII